MCDINESLAIILPPRTDEITNENSKDYVIQIGLNRI